LSTKNSTALATLVVALPAALLGFFLVMSFVRQLDLLQKQGTMYVALYGTTLAGCAALLFLPAAVLIFGPKTAKAGAAPKSSTEVKAAPKSGTVEKAPPTGELEVVEPTPSMDSLVAYDDEAAPGAAKSRKAMSTGELEVVEPTPSMDDIVAYDDEPKASRKGMPTSELEVVEPTPSMDDLVAYDDEVMPKSGEVPAVDIDEDFAMDDEPPKPPKKKGK
jgi:hypothetical protein